jgi:hypothetical protein
VSPLASLLAQLDEERRTLLFWLVLLLLPVAGRILRAVLDRSRVGAERPQGSARDPRERRREAQQEQRRVEQEGEDLWRRLVQGEEAARPRETPAPAPTQRAARRAETRGDVGGEPRSLAVLGEVVEPGAAPEVSLESETEPAPLQALGEVTLVGPAREASAPQPSLARVRFEGRWLRAAIVMAEIVGPPLALRGPEQGLLGRPAALPTALAEKGLPAAQRGSFPARGGPEDRASRKDPK